MLTVIDKGNRIVHVQESVLHYEDYRKDSGYLNYVPVLGKMSFVRTMELQLLEGKSAADFQAILDAYPHARIVHYLDNAPFITEREQEMILAHVRTLPDIAAWKRVKDQGIEIIDEFGFHLYIRQDIDFYGNMPDIDLRYQTGHV